MKNLKLLYSRAVTNQLLLDASTLCADPDSGKVYFASNRHLYWVIEKTKEMACLPLDFDRPEKMEEERKKLEPVIVSMEYLIETQSVCMAFSSGDILVYSTTEEITDSVGSVCSGICAAAWGPDQELLVILTCVGNFIIMTKEFDVLMEQDMQPSEFGECSPVAVGWGSKETQFHGSEGKQAAQVKVAEPQPALSWDDKQPRISWRGDGDFFVTSVVDKNLGCRKLRVWNREGTLCYTSENKDGLEHTLCWKPSGGTIACTQQHPNKHEVIFFEKNGLHHGEFTLPFPPNSFLVKDVLWNIESSIFIVWGHEMANPHHFKITVWTVSNYHWYLKQILDFNKGSNFTIKHVSWDAFRPCVLHVLVSGGYYYQYCWTWAYNRSLGISDKDGVSVAVIDGGDVRITPFKPTIVPPPLCSYSFTCPSSINHIMFSPCPFSEDFCVVLANNQILHFSKVACGNISNLPEGLKSPKACNGFKSMVEPHFFAGTYRISWKEPSFQEYPNSVAHFAWLAENKLLHVSSTASTKSSLLFSATLPKPDGNPEEKSLNSVFHARIEETVIGIAANESGTVAAIQLASGKLLKYHGSLLPWLDQREALALPSPCPTFSVHELNKKNFVLGVSDKFSLCGNDKTLLSNCVSYCCHGEFLITISCDSLLKCYSLNSVLDVCEGMIESLEELASQPVEQGSRILASVPMETKVILQAPRGNLEVIHPRPLVLSAISKYVNKLHYNRAFDLAREHRIDFNVLYDHNPQRFLDTVKSFVDQLNSPSDVNLFLVSLANENISHKLYAYQYPEAASGQKFTMKCDLVCDAVQKVLASKDPDSYFETLIATYCRRTEPALEEALLLIKAKKDDVSNSSSQSLAEKGMKFILCLVDIGDLYKVALGTYDFSLAVMVAEKSNMDPKEYLPFLNELQELEENYRKHRIDMYLQRYKSALNNICKCENRFDECLDLVKEQRLYTSALNLFPSGSSYFKAVWTAYGDYLMSKLYYSEAGLVYWKSENYERALKAYQESGDWQLALSAAHHLHYPQEKILMLSQSLALRLKEQQKYEESALLLEQYAQEMEQSILTLIEGHVWDSAVNLIAKYQRMDMVKSYLIPALCEHQQQLLLSLRRIESGFCRHFERLKVVRENEVSGASTQHGSMDTTDDDMSETSSISSLYGPSEISKTLSGSLITRKSSRSKRKVELKKYRLKEGSANEEMALIVELKNLVTKIDSMKDGLFSFLRSLVQFELEQDARELQKKMKDIISMVEKAMPCIWVAQKTSSDVNYGPDFTVNALYDVTQRQIKTIKLLSDPALNPPAWQSSNNLFLQLLD